MMIKVSEATNLQINWLVAKCKGIKLTNGFYNRLLVDGRMSMGQSSLAAYNPTTDWAQGGPILEREGITLSDASDTMWSAGYKGTLNHFGPTPLIAAMRCMVSSKLGKEVEVPDVLA